MSRQKKADPLRLISARIAAGQFLDTRHAQKRQAGRNITRSEVLQILMRGHHEKRKDVFDQYHGAWNYAVRGKTVDGRALRIIVSFEEIYLIIVTAIDLGKSND